MATMKRMIGLYLLNPGKKLLLLQNILTKLLLKMFCHKKKLLRNKRCINSKIIIIIILIIIMMIIIITIMVILRDKNKITTVCTEHNFKNLVEYRTLLYIVKINKSTLG